MNPTLLYLNKSILFFLLSTQKPVKKNNLGKFLVVEGGGKESDDHKFHNYKQKK
jgi:hypothetical protein